VYLRRSVAARSWYRFIGHGELVRRRGLLLLLVVACALVVSTTLSRVAERRAETSLRTSKEQLELAFRRFAGAIGAGEHCGATRAFLLARATNVMLARCQDGRPGQDCLELLRSAIGQLPPPPSRARCAWAQGLDELRTLDDLTLAQASMGIGTLLEKTTQATAEDYLRAARLGAAMTWGSLTMHTAGVFVIGKGLAGICRLQPVAQGLPASDLVGLDRDLAEVSTAIEFERLRGTELILAQPLTLATQWNRLRSYEEEVTKIQQVASIKSPAAYWEGVEKIQSRHDATGASEQLYAWERTRVSNDGVRTRVRLLVGAALADGARDAGGLYPQSLAHLPVDPFAWPAELRYESIGRRRGYRIWSVGIASATDRLPGAAGPQVVRDGALTCSE
jgi:hypothetical protein